MSGLNVRDFAADSHTVLYGVLGDPVRHSKSPLMLNRAFRETGMNAVYTAFHVKPDRLHEAVQGIRALGLRGVNVTIPHKEQVMQHLDEIDDEAREIGAVNTIVNEDGRLIGYNTDGIGYVRSIKEETGTELSNKRILFLGAGGASRGLVYVISKEQPAEIWIANRTKERAQHIAQEMKHRCDIRAIGMEELPEDLDAFDIIINNTPVGMHPLVDETPLASKLIRPHMIVSDVIYTPMYTRLLREAEQAGATIHSGLGMFIYQGAYAFEYWTGQEAPVQAMREIVLDSFS